MSVKKKDKKWIKVRHLVARNIIYVLLKPYTALKYGIKIEKFKEQGKRPYLILLNHQTPFDQFFVGMAFKGRVYYVATEDIFSLGWISSVIKYLVAPIPIKKQTTDVRAILNCIKVSKEGGTIAIAPEGNRTYSGRTEYMSPSIVPLARKLGLPIALFRIEGGYGAEPRWSDVVRRGKMRACVSEVIEPEEYSKMTDEELFSRIESGLFVDEAKVDGEFRHKKLAEYLERAIYVCPECGLSTFESSNDLIECKKCGMRVRYLPTKEFVGEDFDFRFRFVAEWYDHQSEYMNSLDVLEYTDEPMYKDLAAVFEVIPCKKKVKMAKNVEISLYGNRIEINANEKILSIAFDETLAVTVLGRNKLNIYHGGSIYQLKGSKRFNALKYVHVYNRYKNIKKGDENVKFLGI
ncbi:MAG: 1-acyl-sn-glycerol-3-phosphate acyltransferase [Clostridia bacterium]|nr:1-acyl-sn-glycerol-3-phosphate acyltransferase [Clostridia bacterium]